MKTGTHTQLGRRPGCRSRPAGGRDGGRPRRIIRIHQFMLFSRILPRTRCILQVPLLRQRVFYASSYQRAPPVAVAITERVRAAPTAVRTDSGEDRLSASTTALAGAPTATAAPPAVTPAQQVHDLVVEDGVSLNQMPRAVEERLLHAMRLEQALVVEDMKAWDSDPIWIAYEEEANKLQWEINQKWNKLGVHLRDPRIREQCHAEMAAALEDLQRRYATEVAQNLKEADIIRLMRLPAGTQLNAVNFTEVMQRLFNLGPQSAPFGINDAAPASATAHRVRRRASGGSTSRAAPPLADSDSLLVAASGGQDGEENAVHRQVTMQATPASLASAMHSEKADGDADIDAAYDEDADLVLRHVNDDSLSRRVLASERQRQAEEERAELRRTFEVQRAAIAARRGGGGTK